MSLKRAAEGFYLLASEDPGGGGGIDAVASHRPYRPALGLDKALDGISRNRGPHHEPEVVDACLRVFKEKGFRSV